MMANLQHHHQHHLHHQPHFSRPARSERVPSSTTTTSGGDGGGGGVINNSSPATVSSSTGQHKLGRSFSNIVVTAAGGARSRRGISLDHQLQHQRSMSGGGLLHQSDDSNTTTNNHSTGSRRPKQHQPSTTITASGQRHADGQHPKRRSAATATAAQLDVIRLLSLIPNNTTCAVSAACLPTFNGTPICSPP